VNSSRAPFFLGGAAEEGATRFDMGKQQQPRSDTSVGDTSVGTAVGTTEGTVETEERTLQEGGACSK